MCIQCTRANTHVHTHKDGHTDVQRHKCASSLTVHFPALLQSLVKQIFQPFPLRGSFIASSTQRSSGRWRNSLKKTAEDG